MYNKPFKQGYIIRQEPRSKSRRVIKANILTPLRAPPGLFHSLAVLSWVFIYERLHREKWRNFSLRERRIARYYQGVWNYMQDYVGCGLITTLCVIMDAVTPT